MKFYVTVEIMDSSGEVIETHESSEGIVTNAYKWLASVGYPELKFDRVFGTVNSNALMNAPEILCGGLSLFSGELDCKDFKTARISFDDMKRKVAWADSKTATGGDTHRGIMNWSETKRGYFEWSPVYDFDSDRGNCTFQSVCLTHTSAAGIPIHFGEIPTSSYSDSIHGAFYAPYCGLVSDYYRPKQGDTAAYGCIGLQSEPSIYEGKLANKTMTYVAGDKLITLLPMYRGTSGNVGFEGYYVEELLKDYGQIFDIGRYAAWNSIYEDETNCILRDTAIEDKLKKFGKYVNLGTRRAFSNFGVKSKHQVSPSLCLVDIGERGTVLAIGGNPPQVMYEYTGTVAQNLYNQYGIVCGNGDVIMANSNGTLTRQTISGELVWSTDLTPFSTALNFSWSSWEEVYHVSEGFGSNLIVLKPYRKNDICLLFNAVNGAYIGWFYRGRWGSAYIGFDCLFYNPESPIELQMKNNNNNDTVCLNPSYYYAKANFKEPITKSAGQKMRIKLRLSDEQVIHKEGEDENASSV